MSDTSPVAQRARAWWRLQPVETDLSGMPPASLGSAHASVAIPDGASRLRRFMAFVGPGYLISVGYMDPGNWATDLAAGSRYGYTLLSIVLLSNLMAIVLQSLSARLGIATGRDLAQACRAYFPPVINIPLWLACEIAIIACDLAEVIGTAIALQLLFGVPLIIGSVLTVLDAFIIMLLMRQGFRWLEAFVVALLAVIAGCFAIQIIAAHPPAAAILHGMIPSSAVIANPGMLYVAIGIIGATVMPHNLYLHSSLVQTRAYDRSPQGKREAIGWSTLDSTLALILALFVNAAILIVAAAAFNGGIHQDVAEIAQAYRLISPLLGLGIASTLFATALLAAGMNSTVTGTLAGQIIMEGFLSLKMAPWARRMLTRSLAVLPVLAAVALYGDHGVERLLVFSQIVLSMQLPFAAIPLVWFTTDRRKMGEFVVSRHMAWLAWAVAALIVALNLKLLYDSIFG